MLKSSVFRAVELILLIAIGVSLLYINDKNSQDKVEIMRAIDALSNDLGVLKEYTFDADQSLSERLTKTETSLGILSKDAQSIASMQSRLEAESASKLAELSREIEGTQLSLNLSSVVNVWRPYIAKIECEWDKGSKIYSKSGSAFLTKSAKRDYPHLITSKHVITLEENEKPDECLVKLPDISKAITVPTAEITLSYEDYDLGYISLESASFEIESRAEKSENAKICDTVNVGDKVVILGYPGIGTKNDVTATEGIISGTEKEYFITSAKVEQGNSGGAAVLVPQTGESCYLGIPTFASAGKIEALARILYAKYFR